MPTVERDLRAVDRCSICHKPVITVPLLRCSRCGAVRYLRCYYYSPRPRVFRAECIDLDITSQGASAEQAIGKLQEAVYGYLSVAAEGDTTGLILRRSPLSNRLRYYLHVFRSRARTLWRHRHQPTRQSDAVTFRLLTC